MPSLSVGPGRRCSSSPIARVVASMPRLCRRQWPVLRFGDCPADRLFRHILHTLPAYLLPPGLEESG